MKIKSALQEYPRLDTEKLLQTVRKYKVISFDIFDTLLKRDTAAPHDVFDLVEKAYNERCKKPVSGFRKSRVEAERLAREKAGGREITLRDIYKELAEIPNTGLDKNALTVVCDLEKEIEQAVCVPNYPMQKVFNACVQGRQKVLLISDMYLDKAFIEGLLRANGFSGYDALYVSSEYGCQKLSGKLYSLVREKEAISTDEWLHIGDGKRSDYLAARRQGIHTVCIGKKVRNTRYLLSPHGSNEGYLYSFINNRLPSVTDHNTAIGYEVYGPLLYGFTKWLAERLNPEKTTLFFARDCYTVLKAYQKITSRTAYSHYFEASRKSLSIPALAQDCSMERVKILVRSEPKQFSLRGFLKKFGLVPNTYEGTAKKHGLSLDTVLDRDHICENEKLKQFWTEITPDVKSHARVALAGFDRYFEEFDCTKDIQIVDIGWRCTMQYCLRRLLSETYSLHGYYFGVREDAFLNDGDLYDGFYFFGENDKEKITFIAGAIAVLEIFFSAPYGSVEGYREDGSVIYSAYECAETPESAALVKALQEGALQFVDDFSKSPFSQFVDLNETMTFGGLKEMGLHPHAEELQSFGDYPFQMGSAIVKTVDPASLPYYLIHPKRLLYDFANSNWKIAFMKKLMKIPLPYFRIFNLLYRFRT